MQHSWPIGFDQLRAEMAGAWQIRGSVDVVRLLSGKSGATVLEVDIETNSHKGLAILKLTKEPDPAEIDQHRTAFADGGEFSAAHLPNLVNSHVGANGMALLFSVAGHSLRQVQPFARLDHSQQFEAIPRIFPELVSAWQRPTPRPGLSHPSELLQEWLQHKAQPGSRLHEFCEDHLGIPASESAFSVFGHWLPNPLAWLNNRRWGEAEWLKVLGAKSHGDLHGDNLLVRVGAGRDIPYYLIDFSLYRANAPVFYDHAYFEISHLLRSRGTLHPDRWISLALALDGPSRHPNLVADDERAIELIGELRRSVGISIHDNHLDRADHLTLTAGLARIAAGLNFAGKRLDNDQLQTLAFLYASVALRSYLETSRIDWEPRGPVIYDIGPPPPPKSDTWRQVWDECDQFDPGRNVYVLVAGKHTSLSAPLASVIGRLPLSLIIDFDPDSKASGLYAAAAPALRTQRALREMLYDNAEAFNTSAATAWFFAGGLAPRPDTIQHDFRTWRRTTVPPIRRLAENIRDAIAPTPITVLILDSDVDSKRVSALWETLDEIFGDQAIYFDIRAELDAGEPPEASPNVRPLACALEDLLRGLWLMFGQPASLDQVTLPGRSPVDESKTIVTLTGEDSRYLEEDLTIVYSGLSTARAVGPVGIGFWRGNEITWSDLDIDADVPRDAGKTLMKAVLDRIDRFATSIFTLEHRPGAGGTTIARRLLWDLRDQYPTMLLNSLSGHTVGRLEHLYHVTRLPLVIVSEAAVLPSASRDALVRDLKSRNVRFVLCYVVRTLRQSSQFAVPEPMDTLEAGRFFNRYKSIAPPNRFAILDALTTREELRRFRTPFFYGLYSFEEEFTHIGDYVRAHLADLPSGARQVVSHLALASRFSQEGILDAVVLRLLGLSERVALRMTQLFGMSFPRLLRVEDKRLRLAHPLLAGEVLRQLHGDQWIEHLPDLSCEFIQQLVSAAGANSNPVLRLFTGMFISRDFWSEETERKRQFSELLLSIQNPAGQHRVLEQLKTLCPTEAHFWNHLGRHHMYIMHSKHVLTEACLLQAIKLDENNSVHHHALAMAYRSEIRQRLNSCRRRSDPSAALGKITDIYRNASAAFRRTRDLAPTDEHGFITHIQLICEIIQQLFRISAVSDYSQLLGQASAVSEWCRAELNEAGELLERVKAFQPPTEYSDMTLTCQAKVEECYGRFESMINSLKLLLIRGGTYRAPVRRLMASAYHARQKYLWHKTSSSDLQAISELMLENLDEDEPRERDLLMWFQATRRLRTFDDLEALDRLNRWALRSPSADVFYYLYIVHFIRYRQQITDDYRKVIENIERCQSLHVRSGRPRSHEWLAKAPTWFPVIHETGLGDWDYARNMFAKTDALTQIDATVKRIKGPQAGVLSLGPLDVFFVPGTEFLPGRDEGAEVSAYLGFSYEGLRAWGAIARDTTRNPPAAPQGA